MKKNNFFKRIYSLIVLGIVGYSFSFAQTFPMEIEAEDADVRHYMNIKDGNDEINFSGGKRLEGQDVKSSYVQYNINGIEEAGTYNVTVYYASGQDRHFYSRVNDQFPVVVATPDVDSWDTPTGEVTYQVYFDAGNNVLEIGAYNNGSNVHLANIDKLSIDKSVGKIKRPTDMFIIIQEAEEDYTEKGDGWGTGDLSSCSGGDGLRGDGSGAYGNSWAKYNLTVPEAGQYDVLVYYASMDGNRKFYMELNDNDSERMVLDLPEGTPSWGNDHNDSSTPATYRIRKQITLLEGENSIEFGSATEHSPNLDKFEIIKIGVNEEDLSGSTGIQSKSADLNVYASSSKIFINNTNANYAVFNVLGDQIVSGQCAGSVEIGVPAGIYIVKVNNSVVKVLVK